MQAVRTGRVHIDRHPLPLDAPSGLAVNRRKAMTADDFRTLEHSRLRALVERDMPLAWRLHAPDFQLVTPRGHTYSREAYLGEVESGGLRYLEWTPEAMEVHAFADVALLR